MIFKNDEAFSFLSLSSVLCCSLDIKPVGEATDKEKLEESLENMKTNLAEKEQEQITLHIKSSEKDEIINKKTHSIEKIKKKNEKLMQKLIDIAEMKDGLDNRLTMTEIK